MPKISIIVPVYKVEKYLRRCLDSIVNQTFTDWECILVDDGSPDNSGKICDEYAEKDERFRVFHQKNAGVSAARNKGIDEARGEFVNFVDSDDWVDSSLLETTIEYAKDYEIVFWGNYNCLEDGNIVAHIPKESSCINNDEKENELYHLKNNIERFEYFGYTWNKMFRMSVIRNHSIKFIEGLTLREDELFTMEYCQYITSLKVISAPLYYYRYCMGLSNVEKSLYIHLLYVDNLQKLSLQWQTKQLKELDLFRYSLQLFATSCDVRNIFRRMSLAINAYQIKHKHYVDDFKYVNTGAFKWNMIIGVLYSMFGFWFRKRKN